MLKENNKPTGKITSVEQVKNGIKIDFILPQKYKPIVICKAEYKANNTFSDISFNEITAADIERGNVILSNNADSESVKILFLEDVESMRLLCKGIRIKLRKEVNS